MMPRSPRFRLRIPAFGRFSPACRETLRWALCAAVLVLGGCSDPSGGDTDVAVAEVALADGGGEFLIATSFDDRLWLMRMDEGDEKAVQFRLRGVNGVPIPNPGEYSVAVRIADRQVGTWTSTADRAGVFRALKVGQTTFRLDVTRGEQVVFTSGAVTLEVR